MCFSFWRNSDDGRWHGYKATLIMGAVGVAKTLVDNYWVLTHIPLAGQDGSEVAEKVFYMIAQLGLAAVSWGTVGLIADYERNRYYRSQNQELLPMR